MMSYLVYLAFFGLVSATWKCDFQNEAPWGLPAFRDSEREWPMIVRTILYLLGLCYLFLGVGLISDIFMSGIEKVTSWRKRVTDKETGKVKTVFVWNGTCANLTLMALGSSAPEILLSVIEITTNDMLIGGLGAGTIVGSAAFNLLVISAVCVMAIEDGEVRKIKMLDVYAITATFSVFAYLWLMFILLVTSPDVVELWEAILTGLFLPILVLLAYLADVGKISFGLNDIDPQRKSMMTIADDATPEELAEIEQKIRGEYGHNLRPEQVVKIMEIHYMSRRNKAYYAQAKGKKAKNHLPSEDHVTAAQHGPADDLAQEKFSRAIVIGWKAEAYAFMEGVGQANVTVTRSGPTESRVTVHYKTRDGTAVSGEDFDAMEGDLVFEKGETEKVLSIHIIDDNAYEDDEDFYVDLSNPRADDPESTDPTMKQSASCQAVLAEVSTATITIMDDDDPGKLRFQHEELTFEEGDEDKEVAIVVERFAGSAGKVTCKYCTGNMAAIAGVDYEEAKGTIELDDNVMSYTINVTIKACGRYTSKCDFNLILKEAEGGLKFAQDTDGGEDECICNITIKGKSSQTRDNLIKRMDSRLHASKVANSAYRQQFIDAIFKVGDDDDDEEGGDSELTIEKFKALEAGTRITRKDGTKYVKGKEGSFGKGEEPTDGSDMAIFQFQEGDELTPENKSKMDIFVHIIAMPMKLVFATVPPPDYCGGWLTFIGALVFIALITALVGDMAMLVGCCLGLPDEVTAITFVALGTSLPDTLASKAAAEQDSTADNSIGNVTGSNSVNVFIGIGLSWGIAACYWQSTEITDIYANPNDPWMEAFNKYDDDVKQHITDMIGDSGKAVFMCPAGTIWFNLLVFSLNAFCAIQHLAARRKKWGGELGGPKKGFLGQYFSFAFLCGQWFIYIGASTAFCFARK